MNEYGEPEHGDFRVEFSASSQKMAFIEEYYTSCEEACWCPLATVDAKGGLDFGLHTSKPLPAEVLIEAYRKVGLVDKEPGPVLIGGRG